MNTPKSRILSTLAALFASAALAFSNTPLLVDTTNFTSSSKWIGGSNKFGGGGATWLEFVGTLSGAYTLESRVATSGSGFIFSSWDDGTSDKLENFLFQEWGAGPAGSPTPSQFTTGDVIVFKGSARATRVGANTSDMIVRAFIKMLGYNELGWAFQTKPAKTVFHNIGSALEPFELSITFPDLIVDDSFQVLQIGFEITNSYDAAANSMDSGTIYFENLQGYIEGTTVEPTLWNGYEVTDTGHVDTGAFMGVLFVTEAPWVYVHDLNKWVYLPAQDVAAGAWINLMK
jgi:hypothetical protein